MPPSRHSSSSHSSSHHSSSHHSSSHHSSSSHSSSSRSYSSGPSSHSSSSHYSSSSSTSRSYAAPKPRYNQPRGCSYTPVTHRCRSHEYFYYKTPWVDATTGTNYRSGYYDENGNYYSGLITKQGDKNIAEFECEYCGNRAKYEWKEGEIPTCSCCAAQMTQVSGFAVDSMDNTPSGSFASQYGNRRSSGAPTPGIIKSIIAFVVIMAVINSCSVLSSIFGHSRNYEENHTTYNTANTNNNSSSNQYSGYNPDIFGYDLYLEETYGNRYIISAADEDYSKYLWWEEDYESYYDRDSDCYVWYNTDVEPAIFQYWYEGISSEYGDNGWMEYNKDGWWIETDDDEWEPYTGDTSKLWYIDN